MIICAGLLADVFGRRRCAIALLGIYFVCSFARSFTPKVEVFVMSIAMEGFCAQATAIGLLLLGKCCNSMHYITDRSQTKIICRDEILILHIAYILQYCKFLLLHNYLLWFISIFCTRLTLLNVALLQLLKVVLKKSLLDLPVLS